MIESFPSPVPAETEKPIAFKPLEIQAPLPDTKAAVLIHLPNATLEVQNGAAQATLEAVLSALKSTC